MQVYVKVWEGRLILQVSGVSQLGEIWHLIVCNLTSANTGFHLLITMPHVVTSSPALQESTKSSSRITHMDRGIVPTASFWTCS